MKNINIYELSKRPDIQLFVCLGLSSFLVVLTWILRAYLTQERIFLFMNWNLFLAWIPVLSSWAMFKFGKQFVKQFTSPSENNTPNYAQKNSLRFLILFMGLLTFFFLPNAPYLITDLIHLRPHSVVPMWLSSMMLFLYAWNGVILFYFSLALIRKTLELKFNEIQTHVVLAFLIFLNGYGVYLGRFARLNSWEVVTNPLSILEISLNHLIHPLQHPRMMVISILFGVFLWVTFYVLEFGSKALRRIDS